MLALFAAAIFLSAALLFIVQPMSGKVLLPLLGGSPGVWNACMVFYQGVLLLGYLYSHLTTRHLPRSAQAGLHLCLLAGACVLLPMPIVVGEPGETDPILWVLRTLAVTVGLPFFVVSTTGPLLQRWFSTTTHPAAKDPYFLYSMSNAGSLVGLLAYPLAVEPLLARRAQSTAWTGGFILVGVLIAACAWAMLRSRWSGGVERDQAPAVAAQSTPWRTRLLWLALAFAPSSLMLGVTQHISTDIAAIPLLWVLPLALYLLSFIMAYSRRGNFSARTWGRVLPFAVVATMMTLLMGARSPLLIIAAIHVACFFIAALTCHTRLAEARPEPARLTEYYLIMSLGGVLGGIANAIVSPLAFDSILEYPLMLGLVCLLRPQVADEGGGRRPYLRWLVGLACGVALAILMLNLDAMVERRVITGHVIIGALRAGVPTLLCILLLIRAGSVRFALSATLLLVAGEYIGEGGTLLHQERTFFGVHRVTSTGGGSWHKLVHGTTLHGLQARNEPFNGGKPPPLLDPQARYAMLFMNEAELARDGRMEYRQLIPTTYYHPSGPIGDVFRLLYQTGRLDKVALVGLGAGSLAAYAMPGSRFTFFEIDPAVIRIAGDSRWFSFIADASRDPSVKIGYEFGDGRLRLRSTSEGPFNLIVLDAFSSDAIPVHLLTKEALEIYLSKLTPHGLLAFHISNRYFNLTPPLRRAATELGLTAFERRDDAITSKSENDEGKRPSGWVILCRNASDFDPLGKLPTWERLTPDRSFPLWTDDYSNLLRVIQTD